MIQTGDESNCWDTEVSAFLLLSKRPVRKATKWSKGTKNRDSNIIVPSSFECDEKSM